MPTITVKNIPSEVYASLKQSAERNRRSLNSEIIACLEQAVLSHRIDPELLLARVRQLRESITTYRISEEEFDQVKNEARP